MTEHEELTPEEEDVRNQLMLRDLQQMYAPVDEVRAMERMRKRLLAGERTSNFNTVQTPRQFMGKTRQERVRFMNDIAVSVTQKKGQYLNILAAGIVAVLLVGSLLFAVTRVYQSSTGGAGSSGGSSSGYGSDWKVLATFKGKGSKNIAGLHLVYNHVLGAWFTCIGKGSTIVRLDSLEHGKGFNSACHVEARGKFSYKLSSGAPLNILEKIYIVVDKNSSWELQLANCVGNEQTCGYPGGPTPTVPPVPTAASGIPVATPTVLPVPPTPTVAP